MKKIHFMIFALLTLVSNAMAGDKIYFKSSAEGCECSLQAEYDDPDNDGKSQIKIYLSSPSSDNHQHQFFAFQMFIALNEGITPIADEEEDYGDYVIYPSDRFGNTDKKKAKYGIQIAQKGNGYQIVCLNQQGNAILESEGLLLTIPINNVILNGNNSIGEINEIEFTTLEGKAVRFYPESITPSTIVGMKATVSDDHPSKVYNLSGQETNSTKKGILIKDRKKIVNK